MWSTKPNISTRLCGKGQCLIFLGDVHPRVPCTLCGIILGKTRKGCWATRLTLLCMWNSFFGTFTMLSTATSMHRRPCNGGSGKISSRVVSEGLYPSWTRRLGRVKQRRSFFSRTVWYLGAQSVANSIVCGLSIRTSGSELPRRTRLNNREERNVFTRAELRRNKIECYPLADLSRKAACHKKLLVFIIVVLLFLILVFIFFLICFFFLCHFSFGVCSLFIWRLLGCCCGLLG